MSGGSYDYLCFKIGDAAEELASRRPTPLRLAFAQHLKLIEKALHDIEWVDSSDYSPGDEDEAIKAALGSGGWQAAVLDELRAQAVALGEQIETVAASLTA